jgi:peptide/nickel transport system substrate-binding protein
MGTREDSGFNIDPLTRRELVRGGVGGAVALAAPALLAACGGSSSGPAQSATTATQGQPKVGGTLRAGLSGGTSSDTLDGQNIVNNTDGARSLQLYNGLAELDLNGTPRLALAEEITPNAGATEWTVRVKSGIEFHDGKTLSADDIIFSLRRLGAPNASQALNFSRLDLTNIRKLDDRTLRIPAKSPFSVFGEWIASFGCPMYPTNWTKQHPIGTGPFMYESFTPGEQSTFVRNPHYWEPGLPYLDRLVIIDFADETSQINALLGGQVDVIDKLSSASLSALRSQGAGTLVSTKSALWNPFTMRTDQSPFSDVRVRQAMRLVVDRPAMNKTVFAGLGHLGNDLFALADPAYDSSLPQREQDIEQAKALLKQAGRENLTVELVTAPIGAGVVNMAQVYAEQASAAGVNVQLRQVTSTDFFGPNYTKWLFAQDEWPYASYLNQVNLSTVPGAPFNETHFDDAQYLGLFNQALATADAAKRRSIEQEMQYIDYTRGGYIIPTFVPGIDGYSKKVAGLQSSVWYPLGSFGFKHVWFE